MSEIYNYINPNDILNIHDYDRENVVHKLTNIKLRTENTNFINFYAIVGINEDNKIISITSKQLSFLVSKLNHFVCSDLAISIKKNYNIMLVDNNIEKINGSVFQFFDYESISGTGHSYDCMFYLLYNYFKASLHEKNVKLLVVKSNNKYYNDTIALIKKYYNVEFLYIDEKKTYLFDIYYCCQNYQNVFFHEVKEFINTSLINKIMNTFDTENKQYFDCIYKIKTKNINNVDRLDSGFELTCNFKSLINKYNIVDISNYEEDYKIYLLNKAKKIIITHGSTYYININYYIKDTSDKFISLIFHPNIKSEINFFQCMNGIIYQNMPLGYSGNISNQVYNTTQFKGELLIMDSLDDYENQSKLLSI